jgi:hypothetical protein
MEATVPAEKEEGGGSTISSATTPTADATTAAATAKHIPLDHLLTPPALPSGYDYFEYDRASAMCRGYAGWTTSPTPLPPCIDPTMSKPSARAISTNDRYNLICQALSLVGCSAADVGLSNGAYDFDNGCGCMHWRGEEWTTLLNALMCSDMPLTEFQEAARHGDVRVSGAYGQMVERLEQNKSFEMPWELSKKWGK